MKILPWSSVKLSSFLRILSSFPNWFKINSPSVGSDLTINKIWSSDVSKSVACRYRPEINRDSPIWTWSLSFRIMTGFSSLTGIIWTFSSLSAQKNKRTWNKSTYWIHHQGFSRSKRHFDFCNKCSIPYSFKRKFTTPWATLIITYYCWPCSNKRTCSVNLIFKSVARPTL